MLDRARATSLLLKLAKKYPFLFSSTLQSMPDLLVKDQARDARVLRRYTGGRVFESGAEWESTEITTKIDESERKRVEAFLHSIEGSNRKRAAVEPINFVSLGGYSYRGIISINSDVLFSRGKVELKSNINESVSVSITSIKGGVSYLTLEFRVSQAAKYSLKGISLDGLKTYYVLETFNPFKRDLSYAVVSPLEQAEELISARAKFIAHQTMQSALELLLKCKIKRVAAQCILAANVFFPYQQPYFSRRGMDSALAENNISEINEEGSSCFSLIRRKQHGHFDNVVSDNVYEFFNSDKLARLLYVDALYIACEEPGGIDEGGHGKTKRSIKSPIFLIMLAETERSLNRLAGSTTRSLLKPKANSETMNSLFFASVEADKISERLDAIKSSPFTFSPDYARHGNKIIKWLSEQNEFLRSVTAKRRDLVKAEIEYNHINWTRFYSWVVLFFVLVQVAISTLGVDWTKDGIAKNIIYKNFEASAAALKSLYQDSAKVSKSDKASSFVSGSHTVLCPMHPVAREGATVTATHCRPAQILVTPLNTN